MKRYSMTWKDYLGTWQVKVFEATCDTDARLIVREEYRDILRNRGCGMTLYDFWGNFIEL